MLFVREAAILQKRIGTRSTRDQEMKSRIGKPAIEFALKDTDGNIHRLEDDAGHWLLLVFHRHLG